MAKALKILKFDKAMQLADQAGGKQHVLLGNGFSIGAHPMFRYGTLYEQARKAGLPKHVHALFDRYGTANFEEVLRQLDEGQWLADHYRMRKTKPKLDMRKDHERVKQALVDAIADSHPPFPDGVGEAKLAAAADFLDQFYNVFTTNYDLLLYWASLVKQPFPFEDGFGREVDADDSYCEFLPASNDRRHIYFLHGALHLYTAEGEVRKMVWNTTGIPLMEQVKEALEKKKYPLVVSEGGSQSKSERIEASSYLSNCLRKFANIRGSLFLYGSSLSQQDDHIWDVIATNTSLPRLFVGVRGNPSSQRNLRLVERAAALVPRRKHVLASGRRGGRAKAEELEVRFFDSTSGGVWTPKPNASPLAA